MGMLARMTMMTMVLVVYASERLHSRIAVVWEFAVKELTLLSDG